MHGQTIGFMYRHVSKGQAILKTHRISIFERATFMSSFDETHSPAISSLAYLFVLWVLLSWLNSLPSTLDTYFPL
jgi:hypothetical protein